MKVLHDILAVKATEVAAARAARSLEDLTRDAAIRPRPRSLAAALHRPAGAPVRVLAEIKRASPSAGSIRPEADPVTIARTYADAGAAALSVLTDRQFFDGRLEFLAAVHDAVPLPVLRKDFVIDPYQVVEARAAGADAVLLIVAALDDVRLAELAACARGCDLDALVEVHDLAEAERALAIAPTLLGVNHRDLSTMQVDMGLTAQVAPRVPPGVVMVAESGIKTAADVAALAAVGAHAILVGESLMRAADPGAALRALRGGAVIATKICGLTRPDDAAFAAARGATYLGMVFWPGSKRAIDRARGKVLAGCARAARADVRLVGVFVDASVAEVEATAAAVGLDVVQLHGDEPVSDGAALAAAGLEVWKAIGLASAADLDRLTAWPAAAHLLDAPTAARGGSGQVIDWGLAAQAAAAGHRIVLAGGLTPHNVATAIAAVKPFAVDVASGVERAPGDKDPVKVFEFLDAAQRQISYLRR